MLKKLIRLNLDDMGLVLGAVGGIFLLIHLGTAIALHFFFESEHSSLLVSGAALPFTSAIVILMISLGHTLAAYTMAVKFSQTRRRALGLTLGLVGFEALCSMGLAALLTLLERAVAPRFWMWLTGADGLSIGRGGHSFQLTAGNNPLLVEDFALDWWWFPLLAAAAVLLGVVMGALILRFGQRGSSILLVIWMAICFSPQLLPWDASWFTFPWQYMAAVGGVVGLACLGWSVRYLLRAPIKN